jgi:hypothetical protein
MKTFICDFPKGLRCTVLVKDKLPGGDQSHVLSVNWNRKLPNKLMPQFIRWMNSVHEELATEWNTKFTQAYLIEGGTIEIWVFEPGKPAKKETVLVRGWHGE